MSVDLILRTEGVSKVGERGQVVLPVDLRRELDIEGGDKVRVSTVKGERGLIVVQKIED
jgi:AbrB family looped-hinge helix DNA binding protein